MDNNTQYWLMRGGVRLGPMTFEELVRSVDSPTAPVWREGLADWTAAERIPELSGLFTFARQAAAPTPNFSASTSMIEPMPPTYLAWSIITMIICCIPAGIISLIYSTKVSSRWTAGDYDGARRASERAALWNIITVICGLISIPFQILWALL